MSATGPPRVARPKVLDQLPDGAHAVIEASAGTGKTFTIEHLVVDRVLRGFELQRILVVTFSERAAAELRARIRSLLWKLLAAADGGMVPPAPGPSWTLDEEARGLLSRAIAGIDSAAISTIHSFCQRLLTENAFAHRRLFSQRLIPGREFFSGVFRDFLRTRLAQDPDFAALLEPHLGGGGMEEDEAFSAFEAGQYKLVQFRGQLEPRPDPAALDRLLADLPAGLPSAQEVAEAYAGRLGEAKILRVVGGLLAAIGAAREAAGVRRLLALGPLLDKLDAEDRALDYGRKVLAAAPGLAAGPPLAALLAHAARHLPEPGALLGLQFREELQERLRRGKQEQGLFDYDDLLEVVAESLRGPPGAAVRASLREKYDLALIDEFQDTDPVQWAIFESLFVDGSGGPKLAVIGDPKQAIYGFRAADVHTYLAARARLTAGEGDETGPRPIVRLTQNFRSSERMIDAYNLILRQETAATASLFQANEGIQYGAEARVSCGDPSVRLVDGAGRELPPVQLLQAIAGEPPRGRGWRVKDVARFVAAEAAALLGGGGPLLRDQRAPLGRRLGAGDLYVLGRKRRELELVAEALAARGIPSSFYKLEGLFQTDEARDLVDLLAAVADPFDRGKLARAWLTPFFALGVREAEAALQAPDDHPLVALPRGWHRLAARRDFRRLFPALLEETGLSARAALLPALERPLANVQRILDLLGEEARRRHATLEELLSLLRSWVAERARPAQADGDLQPLETDRPAVQLMTMHAAKGLEAAVVFLLGGTTQPRSELLAVYHAGAERRAWLGTPPGDVAALADLERRGEEERLLYVALTRARARLYLPCFLRRDPETGAPAPDKLQGSYGILNERLFHVLQTAPGADLFAPVSLPVGEVAGDGAAAGPLPALLSGWTLAPPGAREEGTAAAKRALSRRLRGPLVTSYSQLAQADHAHPAEVDKREATGETNLAETQPAELVTSNVVGNFLHDALEQLPLPHVRRLATAGAFAADAAVRALVEPLADAAGILPVQRPHAYRLLWAALRRPIALGAAGVVPCLAGLGQVRRELEFLFPIPEPGHRLLGQREDDPPGGEAENGPQPFEVRRGLVKGFIDLLFQHGGRTYVGDWKSSVLRARSPEALDAYVEQQFRWQVRVYGVAAVRLLGIATEAEYERRFGGFLYLFLREMERGPEGEPAQGVWFRRPDWATVQGWERTLLLHRYGDEGGAA